MVKTNFATILLIFLVSCCLGLLLNFLNPEGLPLLRENRKLNWAEDSTGVKNNKQNVENTFDEPKAIVLKQAYKLYNQNVLFIDARDFVEYEIAHIKGAVSLPYNDFDKYAYRLKKIPKDKPLIVYCDGRECDLSILLSDKLFDMGYQKVYIFFGGWVDWQLANYPIEGEDD